MLSDIVSEYYSPKITPNESIMPQGTYLTFKNHGNSLRYVMDELGSSLRHSDTPNFRVAPFMYLPNGTLESAIRLVSLFW